MKSENESNVGKLPELATASGSEDLPCVECGKPARWLFMPSSEIWAEEDRWRCDEHVPRNCGYCNSDDDGKELPKPWEPCAVWWYLPEDESSPDVKRSEPDQNQPKGKQP